MCTYTVKKQNLLKKLKIPQGGARLHVSTTIRRLRRKEYRKN